MRRHADLDVPSRMKLCAEDIGNLPKFELHAHLNGCVPTSTVAAMCTEYGLTIPVGFDFPDDLRVTHPVKRFPDYFRPWQIFKQLPVGRKCLRSLVRAAIQALAADGVRYAELRYSISNVAHCNDVSLAEALDWTVDAFRLVATELPICPRLLISINRSEANDAFFVEMLDALKQVERGRIVAGLDLTGDEDLPVARHTSRYFRQAVDEFGLPSSLHAGEAGNADNVRWAITECRATRLGHALALATDPHLIDDLREHDVCVEVCLTSNRITGMGSRYSHHPIHTLIREAIPFVLGTDSPAVHSMSLSGELGFFLTAYGSMRELASTFDAARRFAFDPEAFQNAIPRNPFRQFQSSQDSGS